MALWAIFGEDVFGAIEQGASKIPDYVIVAISSEGTAQWYWGLNQTGVTRHLVVTIPTTHIYLVLQTR